MASTEPQLTPPTLTELKKLKVTELREKLSAAGLETKGVKDELVKRLVEHLSQDKADAATTADEKDGTTVIDHSAAAPVEGGIKQASTAKLTEAEKAKLRAERFGVTTQKQSKQSGAIAGLGMFDPQEEYERRKKRAERFGLPVPVNEHEEKEKKKARAERFGLPVPITKDELEEKKRQRAERFMSEEEKKKKERAARFGSGTSS